MVSPRPGVPRPGGLVQGAHRTVSSQERRVVEGAVAHHGPGGFDPPQLRGHGEQPGAGAVSRAEGLRRAVARAAGRHESPQPSPCPLSSGGSSRTSAARTRSGSCWRRATRTAPSSSGRARPLKVTTASPDGSSCTAGCTESRDHNNPAHLPQAPTRCQ